MGTLGDRLVLPLGVTLAVGAAVAGACLLNAGQAHADPTADPPGRYAPWSGPMGDQNANAFWVDLTKYTDVEGGPAQAETLATTICGALHQEREGTLIDDLADGQQIRVGGVSMLVHAAEWHFCPNKYGKG
jgi:hypothetical protein